MSIFTPLHIPNNGIVFDCSRVHFKMDRGVRFVRALITCWLWMREFWLHKLSICASADDTMTAFSLDGAGCRGHHSVGDCRLGEGDSEVSSFRQLMVVGCLQGKKAGGEKGGVTPSPLDDWFGEGHTQVARVAQLYVVKSLQRQNRKDRHRTDRSKVKGQLAMVQQMEVKGQRNKMLKS